jgi:S-methylmethionine-dependent homocysteine/selenocysteine methylase
MGRELERVGAPFRQPEWSAAALAESPESVTAVHTAFALAGADVLTTNAYAVVPFHIGEERFLADGARLAALAGELARSVADEFGLRVAGCLPPALGSYRPEHFVADAARPILEVLVAAQAPFVDVWLAETQSSIDEASFVRDVIDAAGAARPLWVSYTLADDLVGGCAVLRSGESVAAAARAAAAFGAERLSFNCSPPEVMEAAVREAVSTTDLPIGVYANAFDLGDDDDHGDDGSGEAAANSAVHDIRVDVTPQAYADWARLWIDAGATMVGGCCGVGAAHVAALSADLRAG